MWFFFSRQIVSHELLPWLSRTLNEKITYDSLIKNYQEIIRSLLSKTLSNSRNVGKKQKQDWNQFVDKYEPLLFIFKNIESRRHLILSSHILYHRLTNIQRLPIETTGVEINLLMENKQNRKVKYELLCDTRYIHFEETSKKTMLIPNNRGYTFFIEEGDSLEMSLTLRNIQSSSAQNNSRFEIIMLNNVVWEPITIYELKIKKRENITHNVTIECEERCTQEWVYKFESKIASEYKVTITGDPQFKILSSNNLGYLKKGEIATLRLVYCPEGMNKTEAVLTVTCSAMKELFMIQGVPLNSRKVEIEKYVKPIIRRDHKEEILFPW